MSPLSSRSRAPLVAVLLVAAGCSSTETAVRIGVAGPFGQPRGRSMQLAARLAVEEINAAGGIDGRRIELVFTDDNADAERAVEVARQFYDDPSVVAVIGHLTSGTTLAAAPVYNGGDRPLPAISPSASNPRVSGAGPYTFRICPTDLLHGARLANWAVDRLGGVRAALLYRNDDYGRGVRAVFRERLAARGGVLVGDDPYLDDIPSFLPFLRRIQGRGGADVVMIAGTREGAERILQQLAELGMSPAVMGGDGIAGIEAGDVDAEGVFVSTAYLYDRPGDANAAFVEKYRAAHDGEVPDHRGAGAYDIVRLLARALSAVGADRERLRDYLAGVGEASPAFEGVTGRIAFDRRGDVPDKDVVIGVVRNGRLVTAPGQ